VPHNILCRQFAKAHGRRAIPLMIRLLWAGVGQVPRRVQHQFVAAAPDGAFVVAMPLLECQRFTRLGDWRNQHTPLAPLQNAL
jgi:hypothetical protein